MNLYEARRLAKMVHDDPCGGLPRCELEARAHLRGEALTQALMIAYRKKWIGFIKDYVVATRPEWAGLR